MSDWKPKRYHSTCRTVDWGKDLPAETMEALRGGEVFILLGPDGQPHCSLLMDSYDTIREGPWSASHWCKDKPTGWHPLEKFWGVVL